MASCTAWLWAAASSCWTSLAGSHCGPPRATCMEGGTRGMASERQKQGGRAVKASGGRHRTRVGRAGAVLDLHFKLFALGVEPEWQPKQASHTASHRTSHAGMWHRGWEAAPAMRAADGSGEHWDASREAKGQGVAALLDGTHGASGGIRAPLRELCLGHVEHEPIQSPLRPQCCEAGHGTSGPCSRKWCGSVVAWLPLV